MPARVEFEVGYTQIARECDRLASPQQCSDTSEQLGELERLDHIVVGARLQAADLLL